ncbi:antibiotic biosynthesis monooxygenase [Geodermatophilus obscurus]|uniref:antibiotic biosynthesis monooxygenase n=1 Tax=Geodermatophilus obscurus TaxID=1861 RepID=UPI001AD90A0F|nr:antibiotic biosynthesis monooxygenase [Geodermatophilus obscurus]
MTSPPSVAAASLPVTLSFTRRADPAHTREMTAWIRAGLTMAESFPGFLGAGWVRPRDGSDEWHMLCRFADPSALGVWEASPERAWWLRSAEGLAEVTRTERRTGIEGWFDQPAGTEGGHPGRSSGPTGAGSRRRRSGWSSTR